MFERYTEKARRVIFFARYEASNYGSQWIDTEHLLLGLVREDKALTNRFIRGRVTVEDIRKKIEANTTIGEKVSTSVDLPLSNESKRVLGYAAEEAERLAHKHIGTEHLLLGLLREENCFAAQLLKEQEVGLTTVRESLAAGQTLEIAEPMKPALKRDGILEFVGSDSVRIAVVGISRSGPVPRVGEIVLLELEHGYQRFRVEQVQYNYQREPAGSPHAANALHHIRVYVMAAPFANEREKWSDST